MADPTNDDLQRMAAMFEERVKDPAKYGRVEYNRRMAAWYRDQIR